MKNPIINLIVTYYKARRWIHDWKLSRPSTVALTDLGTDMTEAELQGLLKAISSVAEPATVTSQTAKKESATNA